MVDGRRIKGVNNHTTIDREHWKAKYVVITLLRLRTKTKKGCNLLVNTRKYCRIKFYF